MLTFLDVFYLLLLIGISSFNLFKINNIILSSRIFYKLIPLMLLQISFLFLGTHLIMGYTDRMITVVSSFVVFSFMAWRCCLNDKR